MKLNILFEDKHLIVCEKPAGVPTQSRNLYTQDIVTMLKTYLSESTSNPNEPYLGLIHRLDQPVGGIMVFAKSPLAAKNLSLQLQNHKFEKHYLAIVMKETKEMDTLQDEMLQDKKTNTSKLVSRKTKESKTAILSYQLVKTREINERKLSLIDITLVTGRHHQIRVQTAAHLGGIYGDKKYNPIFFDSKEYLPLCLYAYQLSFFHPISQKHLTFQKEPTYGLFSEFLTE